MTEKVSLLLDGEPVPGGAKAALDEIAGDPRLRDRYTVYGLVGDVLRGNSTPDDGFSRRIFERMKRERARLEPGYDPLARDDHAGQG
jgi:negative regulator of sigma E activity